jgi:hypothetical protein
VGLPKPTVPKWMNPTPARYQAGTGGPYLNVSHALRPDGPADPTGFRPTLCGASVKPASHPFYEQDTRRNCVTCTRVAQRFKLTRRIEPLADIGTAMSLIGTLRGVRHAPEAELRAQVDHVLVSFGAWTTIDDDTDRSQRGLRVAS